MSKFLLTNGFKWIDPKYFDLNKYSSNNSEACVLEVDLQYPKELHQQHKDYPLAPDKIEIKDKMLSKYQVMISSIVSETIWTIFDLFIFF